MECLICHNHQLFSDFTNQKCQNFSQLICKLFGISETFLNSTLNSTTTICSDCAGKIWEIQQIFTQLDQIRNEIWANLIQSQKLCHQNGHFCQKRDAIIQEINRLNEDFDCQNTADVSTPSPLVNLDENDSFNAFPTQNQDLDYCQDQLKDFNDLNYNVPSITKEIRIILEPLPLFDDKSVPVNIKNEPWVNYIKRNHKKKKNLQKKRNRKSRKKPENENKNKCFECNIVFKFRPEFFAHNLKLHPRTLYCHQCPKSFRKERSLNEHLKVHGIGNVLFKCEPCEKLFSRGYQLKNHQKSVHEKIKSFLCQYCSKDFAGKIALHRHISSIHKGITIECTEPNCTRKFTAETLMKNHIKIYHKKELPYICPTCGKGFPSTCNLKDHYNHVHLKMKREMKYKCSECEKTFCTTSNLKNHIAQLHSTSHDFPCPKCNKVFALERKLKNHLMSVHLEGESKFPCSHPKCPKKFTTKKDFQVHYLTNHADESEKPFKCSICSKGFVSNYKVERHKRQVHKIGIN